MAARTKTAPAKPAQRAGNETGACAMLYDGACPFCSREARALRRADRDGRIRFVDISAPDFDPGAFGLSRADVDAQLHFFDTDGRLFRAMAAVRAAYREAGIGRRMAWTGWPVLRTIFDRFYRVFARNRLRWGRWLTGTHRPDGPPP